VCTSISNNTMHDDPYISNMSDVMLSVWRQFTCYIQHVHMRANFKCLIITSHKVVNWELRTENIQHIQWPISKEDFIFQLVITVHPRTTLISRYNLCTITLCFATPKKKSAVPELRNGMMEMEDDGRWTSRQPRPTQDITNNRNAIPQPRFEPCSYFSPSPSLIFLFNSCTISYISTLIFQKSIHIKQHSTQDDDSFRINF